MSLEVYICTQYLPNPSEGRLAEDGLLRKTCPPLHNYDRDNIIVNLIDSSSALIFPSIYRTLMSTTVLYGGDTNPANRVRFGDLLENCLIFIRF